MYIIFNYSDLNYNIFFLWLSYIFIYFYIIFLYHKKSFKINTIGNSKDVIKLEIKNNIYTFIIYFLIVFYMFYLYNNNVYNFSFVFSIWVILYSVLLIIFHDAYFYILHRLLHIRCIYKKVHIYHHKSIHPSILSAYNFHPIEAILYVFVLFIIILVDLNFYAFIFAIFFSDLLNFLGHSWYEIFKNKPKTLFLKYFVTTTYHDLHHSDNKWNYWLYFSWWDKIFDTYNIKYDNINK